MNVRRVGPAVLMLIAAAAPVTARAQTDPTGVEIQPAIVEKDLSSRSYSTPIVLTNHESDPFDVDLSVQELGHDLDGTPRFTASNRLASAFHLSATSFRLEPDAHREVRFTGSIPSGDAAAYVGVIALLSRADATGGSNVTSRTQLAAEFLLRGPKPWIERIHVVDVGVIAGSGTSKTVYATVQNDGNVHVRPRGKIEVRRGTTLLGTVTLEPARAKNPPAILPTCGHGCARRLKGTWTPAEKPKSRITLRAVISDPNATGSRSVSFGSGGTLTPAGTIVFQHAGADGIRALVTNTGPVTLTQATVTTVATQDGRFERARKIFPLADLRAKQAREVSWDPTLPDGTYTITAQLTLGETLLDQAITSLQIGAAKKGGSLGWLVALAAALLLAAAAAPFVIRRARRASAEGFTLIELLIVIVILGILAAVVVFAVGGITSRGTTNACKTDWSSVNSAQEAYKVDHTTYASDVSVLMAATTTPAPYLKTSPSQPDYRIDTDGTGAVSVYAPGTATAAAGISQGACP